MSTVLTADYNGKPLPRATWQIDFGEEIPSYTEFFESRFRMFRPEMREELVQEALVQTAIVFESQYRLHGGRTRTWLSIGLAIVGHVKQGRQSTRPVGRNGDLLDYSRREIGPQRKKNSSMTLANATNRPSVFSDFWLDLLDWIQSQPIRHRTYALLACYGIAEAAIRHAMGVSANRIKSYRVELHRRWKIANHCPI